MDEVKGFTQVYKAQNCCKVVTFHFLDQSPQGQDLSSGGSSFPEAVLSTCQVGVDWVPYPIKYQLVEQIGCFICKADATVVVWLRQIPRLRHLYDVGEGPDTGLDVVNQEPVPESEQEIIQVAVHHYF